MKDYIFSILCCSLFCFAWGFICGALTSENSFKNKLVDDGFAEFYLDDSFNKQWRIKQ